MRTVFSVKSSFNYLNASTVCEGQQNSTLLILRPSKLTSKDRRSSCPHRFRFSSRVRNASIIWLKSMVTGVIPGCASCRSLWRTSPELIQALKNHFWMNVLELLPLQLRLSWSPPSRIVRQTPVTGDVIEFWDEVVVDYIDAMNLYPYPAVRCVWGPSQYFDEYNKVGSNHVLNHLNSSFVASVSSFSTYITSIRAHSLQRQDMVTASAAKIAIAYS